MAYCDIDKKNRGRGCVLHLSILWLSTYFFCIAFRFIEYLTREDAEAAVRELSGKDLNGNIVTLTSVVSSVFTSVVLWMLIQSR